MKRVSDIHTWTIKDQKLQKLKSSKRNNVTIVSPLLENQYYRVQLYRKGRVNLNTQFRAYIMVLLQPLGVKGMDFNLKIKHKNSNNEWRILKCSQVGSRIFVERVKDLQVKDIMDDDAVTIILQIEITKVYLDDAECVVESDWNKYGIILD